MLIQAKKVGIVTFICELKPDAKEVHLTGDFNQWHPKETKMLKAKDGSFRSSMKLFPGQYRYKFIIDGVWHNDPDAPYQDLSPSGTPNSVFVVEQYNMALGVRKIRIY